MIVEPLRVAEEPASPDTAAVTHLVTDEEMGAAAGGRPPRALCGRVFVPACLLVPLGRTCPACHAAQRPRPAARGAPTGHRRATALRGLLALRNRRNR